jgi:hypothetical protein
MYTPLTTRILRTTFECYHAQVRGGFGAPIKSGSAGDVAAECHWQVGAPPLASLWIDANNVRVVQGGATARGVVYTAIR